MLERIRMFRKRLGYRQEDIAMQLGVTTSHYNHFENGVHRLSFDKFLELLEFLGVRIILTEHDISANDLDNLIKIKSGEVV